MATFVYQNGYKIVSPLPSGNAGEVLNENFTRSSIIPWRQPVIDRLSTPPVSPSENDRYLVVATATDSWSGQEGNIAEYIDSSWQFITPSEGWILRDNDDNIHLEYDGSQWIIVQTIKKSIAVSSNTTASLSDYLIEVDASSGSVTINLPAASEAANIIYNIKKIDSTGNSVIVDGDGSETIDGATTQTITSQWTNMQLMSNGTSWRIL